MPREFRVERRSVDSVSEEVPRPRVWSRLHTFDSLKESDYRWFSLGMLGSFAAVQIQLLARGWLVIDNLEGSALDLGIVASGFGVPSLIFAPFGGVITDRFRKRNLLIITQSAVGIVSLVIAILIVTDAIRLWHVITSAVAMGTIFAFNLPSRQSMIPELVSEENLSNAIALSASTMNLNRVVAPTLGGALVGVIGVEGVYFVIVACYAFAAFSLLMISPRNTPQPISGNSFSKDLKDGFRYVRDNKDVLSLLMLSFAPIVFATSYQALLPVFAKEILEVGSSGLGLLMGVVGVGAVVGTLSLASLSGSRRKGHLLVVFLAIFGLSLFLFAYSTSFYLSMVALFLVGIGSFGHFALTHTLILSNTVPEMQGRVLSMYMITWGLVPMGLMPMGAIAEAMSAHTAVSISAGILLASTSVVLLLRPQVRSLK